MTSYGHRYIKSLNFFRCQRIQVLTELNFNAYTVSEQAAFEGLSILYPSSRCCGRARAEIPGYGIFPTLNTSQHVTPNDHCGINFYVIMNAFLAHNNYSSYISYAYHVCFFAEDAKVDTFWCCPLQR